MYAPLTGGNSRWIRRPRRSSWSRSKGPDRYSLAGGLGVRVTELIPGPRRRRSDYPDMAEWLAECGIDSISLNPDTAIKTAFVIARAEARHQRATSTRMGALSGITY